MQNHVQTYLRSGTNIHMQIIISRNFGWVAVKAYECMFVCVYIYTYIHVCMYICMYIYIYIYIYTHTLIAVEAYIYIYIYSHINYSEIHVTCIPKTNKKMYKHRLMYMHTNRTLRSTFTRASMYLHTLQEGKEASCNIVEGFLTGNWDAQGRTLCKRVVKTLHVWDPDVVSLRLYACLHRCM
jgi:hypothetical protein